MPTQAGQAAPKFRPNAPILALGTAFVKWQINLQPVYAFVAKTLGGHGIGARIRAIDAIMALRCG